LSHPPLVFLSDPEEVRTALTASPSVLHPGAGAAAIEPLVGPESFMLLEGEEHISGRRAVLPAFHANVIREHETLVSQLAHSELAGWPREVPYALHQGLRVLTLETLLRTVFSAPAGPARRQLGELRERLLAMLAVTASTALPQPIVRHGPGLILWRRFLRHRAAVDELLYSIIAARTRAGGRSGDLLDRLLSARNPDGSAYSTRQVRDGLMSIVLAGHETTASQLAWAFQLLAHNPQTQRRLTEELDAGGEEYLTATVREVLRHRPVFLFAIPRAVHRPVEIGGWTYQPPALLLGCIYLLHHDPGLYPDPDRFRPERFLSAEPGTKSWLPWGAGSKRCPGLHLATLELSTVLRTVLASTTVRPAATHIERARWRSVIVTPHAGARVVLHPRP
jgi:cytochrome P450